MASLDDVFEMFTRERRRLALYYLEQQDGTVPIEEVAEQVTKWESDEQHPVSDDEYREVVITLRHSDLPKAAEVDFVSYDPEENVIELTDEPREFKIILAVAEAFEHPSDDGVASLL